MAPASGEKARWFLSPQLAGAWMGEGRHVGVEFLNLDAFGFKCNTLRPTTISPFATMNRSSAVPYNAATLQERGHNSNTIVKRKALCVGDGNSGKVNSMGIEEKFMI